MPVTRSEKAPTAIDVWEFLADPRVPRSDWSISKIMAVELSAHLERLRPQRILEVGSGFSTVVLAAHAARYRADVVTLEHMRKYAELTAKGLRELALDDCVDLRLASLRPQRFGDHGPYQWYDTQLDGKFDFIFVDAPPKVMGRRGVFFAVERHLSAGWQMWMDDGLRHHERKCVRLWEGQFRGRFARSLRDIDGKGVFILNDATGTRIAGADTTTLGHLGVGILVDGESNWWRARRNVGGRLLDSSFVVVTAKHSSAASLPTFVDKHCSADRRSPQERIRWLFDELTGRPEVRYVLYLDDRWSPRTLDESWLTRALAILETQPDVDQVSLQHRIDSIGDVTGRRVAAPFTGAPSLLRADRLTGALPRHATIPQRRPLPIVPGASAPRPLSTVQLSPGVFRRGPANGHTARP